MSQVGQRRGKIGVKGAKNFHLLMKGKITHLALAVWLTEGEAMLFSGPFLNVFAMLGSDRDAIHIWCRSPCFHSLDKLGHQGWSRWSPWRAWV